MGFFIAWTLIIAAILLTNSLTKDPKKKLDHDLGGYSPKWNDKASYLKMYVHSVSALAFGALGVLVGGPVWLTVLVLLLAGWIWERSTGFVNKLDLVANTAGLLVLVLATQVSGIPFTGGFR